MSEYIYAEPEEQPRVVFLDTHGKPHLTRDDAIVANIRDDLERALRVHLARAFPDHHEEREFMARALVGAIAARHNPLREIIRHLIEGTD